MSDELLKQLLDGQKEIFKRLDIIESKIDTGFKNTKESDSALLDLVEKTYRETEKISQNQLTQGESINILALRQLQTESELSAWRKAK